MTAKDLLKAQMDEAGYQLKAAIGGIEESMADIASCDQAMSLREQVAHLCETYCAVLAIGDGRKHKWGSYEAPDGGWIALVAEFAALREQAVACVLADEGRLQTGSDYIVAHDSYHIGQMATARIRADSTWDPYSIYRRH